MLYVSLSYKRAKQKESKMPIYNNILVAIDLRVTHDAYTISRAVDIAKNTKAKLHFIHVMETLHGYGAVEGDVLIDMERKMADDARKSFFDVVSNYGIKNEQLIIASGSPKQVIVEQAKKMNVDLIIVGGHDNSGMQIFVGSTASGVISQAHCDVLTIHTVR